MGFTTTRADDVRNSPNIPGLASADDGRNVPELAAVDDVPQHDLEVPVAADEGVIGLGQQFWRSLTQSLDGVIKSNSTAQVIPSAEAIAAEVSRQQQ